MKIEYTRLKCFQNCPRKHGYIYNENIISKKNKSLILGTLFHQCLEGYYKQDFDLINDAMNKYSDALKQGLIDTDQDLLEYAFQSYTQYYAMQDKDETCLAIEAEFGEQLDKQDSFYLKIDRLVQNNNNKMIVLRDTKTTSGSLKYTYNDVLYNQQLLTYIPYVEEKLGITIDAIEVDEVRLGKLQPVPLNQNGKPSGDKKRLTLVTYYDFYDKLREMGLENNKEYQNALDYLNKRGHPLYNRVRAQILDKRIVESNLNDMYDTYIALKSGAKYRIKGPLCNYCGYSELCNLDMFDPADSDRQIIIDRITDHSHFNEDEESDE